MSHYVLSRKINSLTWRIPTLHPSLKGAEMSFSEQWRPKQDGSLLKKKGDCSTGWKRKVMVDVESRLFFWGGGVSWVSKTFDL